MQQSNCGWHITYFHQVLATVQVIFDTLVSPILEQERHEFVGECWISLFDEHDDLIIHGGLVLLVLSLQELQHLTSIELLAHLVRHAHCADEQHLHELDLQLLVDIGDGWIGLFDNLLLDELI